MRPPPDPAGSKTRQRGAAFPHGDVLVVGAGPAGLSAAAAIAMRGGRVEVAERSPELRSADVGIQVTPNGMSALDRIGAGPGLRRVGMRASVLEIRDFRSSRPSIVLDLERYERIAGRPYLLVHRDDLIRELADAAERSGAKLKFGVEVRSVSDGASGNSGGGHQASANASIIVAADGSRSSARTALNPSEADATPSHVVWRSMVPGDMVPFEQHKDAVRLTLGSGRHAVTYWLRGGSEFNAVLASSLPGPLARTPAADGTREELIDTFRDFRGDVQELLGVIGNPSRRMLRRRGLARVWSDQRTILVGDALHPMLPFLAQGANMAFEDAIALSVALQGNSSPSSAFREFRAARLPRITRTMRAVDRQARLYGTTSAPVRAAMNAALGLAGAACPAAVAGSLDWLFGGEAAN